ncbi:MAG: NAD-dependent epimerase/dehydratase family protein [Planctomycetota bacterium]|nr:MAG: NAD-dependent epimerase/dehydratase family protein [Planctomycetota bacterium]
MGTGAQGLQGHAPRAGGGGQVSGPLGVAVTGAAGFVGRQLVARLAREPDRFGPVLALDRTEIPPGQRLEGVRHERCDIRDPQLVERFTAHGIGAVVHLACVVVPPPGMERRTWYEIDVGGARNVAEAAVQAGVGQFVQASSGAVYGYRAEHRMALTESDPRYAEPSFPYAHHKRIVEDELAALAARRPALHTLVFRISTVLGAGLDNAITRLWSSPVVLGIRGRMSAFSFVWVEDVVEAIAQGLRTGASGTFNLAGDGVMTLAEIAARQGKPLVELPAPALRWGLAALRRLGWSSIGPEHVAFVAHRPVLDNRKLREEFGFEPRLTSREAFEVWLAAARGEPPPACLRRWGGRRGSSPAGRDGEARRPVAALATAGGEG